jgi:hypothetical protein
VSRNLRVKRADTMYLWYRRQKNYSTQLTDAEIAVALNGIAPSEGWVRSDGKPNAHIVREVRSWTDKQTAGDFADIRYGTRENGGGRHGWSHLHDGKQAQAISTLIGATSQLDAVDQRMRQERERRAREAMKLEAQAADFNRLGEFAKAMAIHDAARDVEQYGYVSQRTEAQLVFIGLRTP